MTLAQAVAYQTDAIEALFELFAGHALRLNTWHASYVRGPGDATRHQSERHAGFDSPLRLPGK